MLYMCFLEGCLEFPPSTSAWDSLILLSLEAKHTITQNKGWMHLLNTGGEGLLGGYQQCLP